jgi:hypothetical protein
VIKRTWWCKQERTRRRGVPVLSKEWFARLDAMNDATDKFLRLLRHYRALQGAAKALRNRDVARPVPPRPGVVRKVFVQRW